MPVAASLRIAILHTFSFPSFANARLYLSLGQTAIYQVTMFVGSWHATITGENIPNR